MDSFQEKYNALVIKYDALLAENEELKSILLQHGIVYSSIKRADASAAFSSITYPPIKLSLDEKIALFRNFFKGRDDVFARRWFNKTTEKGGYHLYVSTNGAEEYVTRKSINVQSVPTAILPR